MVFDGFSGTSEPGRGAKMGPVLAGFLDPERGYFWSPLAGSPRPVGRGFNRVWRPFRGRKGSHLGPKRGPLSGPEPGYFWDRFWGRKGVAAGRKRGRPGRRISLSP